MDILENKNNILIIKEKKQVFQDNLASDFTIILKLYSYNTLVCYYDIENNNLILVKDIWRYSQTTNKHFKHFLDNYTNIIYKNRQDFIKAIEKAKKENDFKNTNKIIVL